MKRLLVLLVAIAALVGLAAAYLPSDAASVNGTMVSQSTLNTDLSAITGSPGFQCYLYADQVLTGGTTSSMFPVQGVGSPTGTSVATATKNPASVNAGFSRYWLSQLLTNQLVVQLLDRLDLTVTQADLAFGRTSLTAQINGVLSSYQSQTGGSCGGQAAAILASLPANFRAEQVKVQADQDVLLAHEAGYTLDHAGLLHFFTVHRATFHVVCYTVASFSTEADATAARAAAATGTALTASGGTIEGSRCVLGTTLPSSVSSLKAGQVSEPLTTSSTSGYLLVQVTKVEQANFATVKSHVGIAILEAGSARTSALIRAANREAAVTADLRYGRVAPETTSLLPPKSPPAAAVLNPPANQPAAAAASGSGSSGA